MSHCTHCIDEKTEAQKAVTHLASVGMEGSKGRDVLTFLVQAPHLPRLGLPTSWSRAPHFPGPGPSPSWSRAPHLPGPGSPPSWSRPPTFLILGPPPSSHFSHSQPCCPAGLDDDQEPGTWPAARSRKVILKTYFLSSKCELKVT